MMVAHFRSRSLLLLSGFLCSRRSLVTSFPSLTSLVTHRSSFLQNLTRNMASFDPEKDWKPPAKIEDLYAKTANNKFASINAPTAGARVQQELPAGPAHLQLYSLATPNGMKVGILLEELGVEYDAHLINIGKGEQFTSGFVGVNPNSKIPCLVDVQGPDGQPINLFETASIMLYLCDKYNQFIAPVGSRARAQMMNWIMWQMGGLGPMCGNMGHFLVYAPNDQHQARDYGVARYGMEVQRLCSVMDQHLAGKTYMVEEAYSVADMVCFPWFHQLNTGYKHPSGVDANSLLNLPQYVHLQKWIQRIAERPAVQRGLTVCSMSGAKPWISKATSSHLPPPPPVEETKKEEQGK